MQNHVPGHGRLKVGDTVSEVAFLFHVGSPSTVYAASHVQLLTLRWEDFVNIQAVQKDDVQVRVYII